MKTYKEIIEDLGDPEKVTIEKGLEGDALKSALGKINWKKDHRGISYDKKTGVVTAL